MVSRDLWSAKIAEKRIVFSLSTFPGRLIALAARLRGGSRFRFDFRSRERRTFQIW